MTGDDGSGDLVRLVRSDLTLEVTPATTPLEAKASRSLGSLCECCNSMLAKAPGGLELYNEIRRVPAKTTSELSASLAELREAFSAQSGGDLTVELRDTVFSLPEVGVGGVFAAMLDDGSTAQRARRTTEEAAEAKRAAQEGMQWWVA